jgi:hypothetical protein
MEGKMRTGYITLIFLFVTINLSAQSASLFDAYEIPTYSFYNMRISGQDFLSYIKNNYLDKGTSDESTVMQFNMSGNYYKQSPMTSSKISFSSYFDYSNNYSENVFGGQKYNSRTEYSFLNFNIGAANNFYLQNEKGFFVFIDPSYSLDYDFRAKNNRGSLNLPFGVGYGRIVGVKSMAQAYIIADELGVSLNNEQLNKIAHIIDKDNDGFYFASYRDSSGIQFYKDVTEITGTPGEMIKLAQILGSGLYKVTERFKGWECKLGSSIYYLHNNYWDNSAAVDLIASAGYALPIDFKTQFTTSLNYSYNLDNRPMRMPVISASAELSFMHNYNWRTILSADFIQVYPDDDAWQGNDKKDHRNKIDLEAKTEFALINSFLVYGSLEYKNVNYSANFGNTIVAPLLRSESIMFHLGFSYYLL